MKTKTKVYPRTNPSVAKARAFVRCYLADDDAYLLASEAAQNAVRHGTGANFTVTITFTSTQVRVTVTNAGTGPIAAPTDFPDLDAENGRGIPLMAALAADYGMTSGGGMTQVWFAFPATADHLAVAA